jgi:hypothetical protein
VPGFDGLRVPARLAMIAYVFLAVLGGYGLAALDRLRHGGRLMLAVGVLFLMESTAAPIALNQPWTERGVAAPPARVSPSDKAPPVYEALRRLPAGTVVAELPFGYSNWELRYVYYAAVHKQRVLNGYSGGFPDTYMRLVAALMHPLARPETAWSALRSAGTTHVVVHRTAYLNGEDQPVVDWLIAHGARPQGTYRTDDLFALPR